MPVRICIAPPTGSAATPTPVSSVASICIPAVYLHIPAPPLSAGPPLPLAPHLRPRSVMAAWRVRSGTIGICRGPGPQCGGGGSEAGSGGSGGPAVPVHGAAPPASPTAAPRLKPATSLRLRSARRPALAPPLPRPSAHVRRAGQCPAHARLEGERPGKVTRRKRMRGGRSPRRAARARAVASRQAH